jgi:3-hydroxypropanoate dehydrogenase
MIHMSTGTAEINSRISTEALEQIFLNARTFNAFLDTPVSEETLRELYEITKLGPTSANTSPLRILFVASPEAKAKLIPALMEGNRAKTEGAPVVAVLAYDSEFYEHAPRLFPHADVKSWFTGNAEFAQKSAITNSALQAAYFLLAARALGLDTGPMGGFSPEAVDEAFFAGTTWKSFLVVNLGYGDRSKLNPRLPRLEFDEAVKIL